jgi:hypothetical protein
MSMAQSSETFIKSIWIRTHFEGFHRWPDAPDEVSFLRDRHRHMFHVLAFFKVTHEDRQLEFFIQQRAMNRIIANLLGDERNTTWSCETWATQLLEASGAMAVLVSEDGENGSLVASPLFPICPSLCALI